MDNSIKKILFLGPKGTYSQFACEKFKEKLGLNQEFEPISTITKIIDIIDDNCELAAVLPIENSIEGIVRGTLDGLFGTKNGVKIQAQTQIHIQNCLISYSKKEEITHIISHPQPLSQCQNYISANFSKDIILENASSTAYATMSLKEKGKGWASIGNEYCAKMLNIPVLEKNIKTIKRALCLFQGLILILETKQEHLWFFQQSKSPVRLCARLKSLKNTILI